MAQIFCFGDSITYGVGGVMGSWADILKKSLHQKLVEANEDERFNVYNLGVPGDTSTLITKRLKSEIVARRWHDMEFVLIISVGTNDSKAKGTPRQYVTDLSIYSKNFSELLKQAKQFTSQILCVGLTPIDNNKTQPFGSGDSYFYNQRIGEFDKVNSGICRLMDVEKVELFSKMSKLEYTKLLYDGLHPNSDGYQWMYEQIKQPLSLLLGEDL